MTDKFMPGDAVRVIGGQHDMTVVREEADRYLCRWEAEAELHEDWFDGPALVKHEPTPGVGPA